MADITQRPQGEPTSAAPASSRSSGGDLPRLARPLRPLVDLVARARVGVHAKLLSGFLVGALLLLGMGVLSLVVIARMSDRVNDLTRLQEKVDRARQMEYAVTAQSHFRAMALLTLDDSNNDKIARAKKGFLENLQVVEGLSPPAQTAFFNGVKEANERFRASSQKTLDLYVQRSIPTSLKVHLDEEHPISHELEAAMRELIKGATSDTAVASAAFHSDRRFLTVVVWTFSGVSLAFALLVGFVLSWSFIRPIRRIDRVVADVAAGNFTQRVEVANRDELGTLSANVNRMSQRLGNLYQDMQDELAERRRTEEALKLRTVELVAVNSELESLTYSLSHDLWAPLQSVDSSSRTLAERHADRLDADGREHVQSVGAATRRMRELVEGMVNLSRVLGLSGGDRGEVRREVVDLSALARSVADALVQRDPRRQVEFVIADGLVADGDPRRLRVALENLLGNAWKFTGKHPKARIQFGAREHDGKVAYFVRDDGAGFDMAQSDRLFGPFQRLHPAAQFEGVGVGLATVQRIVRGHGGRVWAEGAVEKGATFYFTLS